MCHGCNNPFYLYGLCSGFQGLLVQGDACPDYCYNYEINECDMFFEEGILRDYDQRCLCLSLGHAVYGMRRIIATF